VRIYATEQDLMEWTGKELPANAAGLLRAASRLVTRATQLSIYYTDTDGVPVHPQERQAFRDATTAQAAFWDANDLDPVAGALSEQTGKVATSKSIKGATVSYDAGDAAAAKAARAAALSELCPAAWDILAEHGLVTEVVAL